ncbi:fumarylacetoacetate hydrolase family protein [Actinomadura madurae]|uniref:fumarylacetoacetate hydrolase family protein n=1 Tax=Actinomadura madurae TaxID=1993 RepID=UPI000D9F669F|nr:fumarylacetoacetate hydrolase family protein [Actinomadura madurae]SPT51248.1 Ureidoglycolate lyase [Actinomadura madurae]
MKLSTFVVNDETRAGVVVGGSLVDLATAVRRAGRPTLAPATVREYLASGFEHAPVHRAAVELAGESAAVPSADVRLLPPVPDPDKILCIGLNYRDHAAEAGLALPSHPMVFAKFRNSLVGCADPIVLPGIPDRIDYEAELAVVIGRTGREIPESAALDHVAGVMTFNDVSARDLQNATSQWTLGKSVDTFGPCGPHLVTLDEIDDIADLQLRTRVNEALVQDGTTAQMVFSVPELVAYLSRAMTLEPGDIIATGTPAGVGFKRTPPVLLTEGDLVEVEIPGVGTTRNPVIAAVSATVAVS